MQALDPCDHFHWLFNSKTSLETDVSPLFAPLLVAQDSLPISGFSTALGSTPRKLRDWRSVDWSFDPNSDSKLDSKLDSGASSLGWGTSEVSPLVQAFLPAKLSPGTLNPALLSEFEETEEDREEDQSSAFDTLDSRNASFDMSTFSSTLSLSYPTKVNSRTQSRFHSLFQTMKSDSEMGPNFSSDMPFDSQSYINSTSESKSPPKNHLITQQTMDFLFGGCIPCEAETIGETLGNIGETLKEPIWENAEPIWENGEPIWENTETFWDNTEPICENEGKWGKGETQVTKHKASASPWDPPKSHPKLWNPFEQTDFTPTPA